MESKGVHFMALDSAKQRLATVEEEYKEVARQLDEAVKMGDLRENSEYDAAKEAMSRVVRVRDELQPVVTMPVVKSNDNISVIEEGSVVQLSVWSITPSPVTPGSAEFESLKQSGVCAFEGIMMFGATLEVHELLVDKALASDTPIGKFILGKQPGDYSIPVPAGYANITATKLTNKTAVENLYCKLLANE